MKHTLLPAILKTGGTTLCLWLAALSPAQAQGSGDYVNDKGDPKAAELLACPANTILSGPFVMTPTTTGSTTWWPGVSQIPSDQEMTDAYGLATPKKVYRAFSNCRYAIDGVKFVGAWAYYDMMVGYIVSNTRGKIDSNYNMTEPQNFEISFYKMDGNGYPGEEVYKEIVSLKGDLTGVGGTLGRYYAFTAQLKQSVKLEEGFVSISAAQNGGPFSDGWFFLLGNEKSGGYSVTQEVTSGHFNEPYTKSPAIYCLLGSTDKPIAEHALKVMNIISPQPTDGSRQAKVTVEVMNVGAQAIDNATLELYRNDDLVATEQLDRHIEPGEGYTYTFAARVDCSEKYQYITVKNVTPGDEGVSTGQQLVEVEPALTSEAETAGAIYLASVKVGSAIDQSSGASKYSDYTEQQATLRPGESLPIDFTLGGNDYRHYNKLWVDWNGNGSFADKGDFVGYSQTTHFDLTLPAGVEVTPGDKRLRLIVSTEDTQPTGTYAYGETEDYTLTVERPANGAAVALSADEVNAGLPGGTTETTTDVTLTNTGNQALTTTWALSYSLPHTPGGAFADARTNPLPAPTAATAPLHAEAIAVGTPAKAPAAPAADEAFTFGYAGDYNNHTIKLSGSQSPLTFAQLYPGEMLRAIKGMELSALDVYVGDQTSGTLIVYGQKSQQEPGAQLVSQQVALKSNQWNTLTLDSPLAVDGSDLWVCLQPSDKDQSQLGCDAGPAVAGFSDLILSDGKWYRASDLGLNASTCMRARFTGTRTPAISWLSLSQSSLDVQPGQSGQLTLTVDPSQLDKQTVYEAVALGTTNDPVRSLVKIPVYLRPAGVATGIASVSRTDGTTLRITADGAIEATGDRQVAGLTAYRVNGSIAASVEGTRLDLRGQQSGVYLVEVRYADGTSETAAVSVRRR